MDRQTDRHTTTAYTALAQRRRKADLAESEFLQLISMVTWFVTVGDRLAAGHWCWRQRSQRTVPGYTCAGCYSAGKPKALCGGREIKDRLVIWEKAWMCYYFSI